jgi:hypothetical protein
MKFTTCRCWAALFVIIAMMMMMASTSTSKSNVVSAATPQCPTSRQQHASQPPQIFGVSKRLPTTAAYTLSVRGGAVLEPESLDDVQAIILKAASEQKLVVIDFTGMISCCWLDRFLFVFFCSLHNSLLTTPSSKHRQ